MVAKQKTFFTTRPSLERQRKNLLFLNLIKARRSLSRTEISRLIEINIVTVSNYVNGYLKKGLVVECGQDFSSGGRKPELLELNKEWGYVVGLDVGEGYVKGVLVNLNMEIMAEETESFHDGKDVKNSVNEIIKRLIGSAKTEENRIRKIGMTISTMSKSPEEILRKNTGFAGGKTGAAVSLWRLRLVRGFGRDGAEFGNYGRKSSFIYLQRARPGRFYYR